MNCSRSFANRQSSLGRKRYLAFAKKRDDRFGKRETSETRQRRGLPLLNQFRAARCCVDACLRISFATRKAKATSECFGLTFPSYPPPPSPPPSTLRPAGRDEIAREARLASYDTCASLVRLFFLLPFSTRCIFAPVRIPHLREQWGRRRRKRGRGRGRGRLLSPVVIRCFDPP